MPLPSHDKLMLPILQKMQDGKDVRRSEVYEILKDDLREHFKINEDEMNETLVSGQNKLFSRINWAFTFLGKAEFIEKSSTKKASYHITDSGTTALADVLKNNLILDEKYLKRNSQNYLENWKVKVVDTESGKVNSSKTNLDESFSLESALEEMSQEVEMRLLARLREMDWELFEDFCAKLIEKMQYGIVQNRLKRVRDGGIDGIIKMNGDELGIGSKIYLQAKRYKNTNPVIFQDMCAFLHVAKSDNAKGVFITTSKFSPDAKKAAEKYIESGGSLAIIDDLRLIKLCVKYKHGLRVKANIELLDVDL